MSKARQAPTIYTLEEIRSPRIREVTTTRQDPKDPTRVIWVPKRSLGMDSFRNRLRCAILAFTGKADLVIWPEDQ